MHSFAQRAEIYCKKRPDLITFVEDFYRAHRSIAERFNHLKSSDNGSRSSRFHLHSMESVYDQSEDADSEVDDPEDGENNISFKEEEAIQISCKEDDTWILEQERLKLIQESEALRKQLLDKDEEKREVIRQLSLTLETLKDDNLRLKRRLGHESLKKRSVLDFKPLHDFFGKYYLRWQDGR